MLEPKTADVTGQLKIQHSEERSDLYKSMWGSAVRLLYSRKEVLRWIGHGRGMKYIHNFRWEICNKMVIWT